MAARERRSPRRWFQFRLGALFLLTTLVALWLAWELSYIRERKSLRAALEESGATVISANEGERILLVLQQAQQAGAGAPQPVPSVNVGRLPYWREWLGDEAIVEILLPEESSPAHLAHAERIFSEADVKIRQRDGITWTISPTEVETFEFNVVAPAKVDPP